MGKATNSKGVSANLRRAAEMVPVTPHAVNDAEQAAKADMLDEMNDQDTDTDADDAPQGETLDSVASDLPPAALSQPARKEYQASWIDPANNKALRSNNISEALTECRKTIANLSAPDWIAKRLVDEQARLAVLVKAEAAIVAAHNKTAEKSLNVIRTRLDNPDTARQMAIESLMKLGMSRDQAEAIAVNAGQS